MARGCAKYAGAPMQAAVAAGKPVAAVNRGRTRADDLLALKVAQPVGEALTALAEQLVV